MNRRTVEAEEINLRTKRKVPDEGFTLIEMMVVIGIISILLAIAIPAYQSHREKAKIAVCIVDMRGIENAIVMYAADGRGYPDTLADFGMDGMKDPWGNPYQYLKISGKSVGKARKDHFMVPINTDYDLYSMGPDGQSASPLTAKISQDDIIRANDGNYMGKASGY